MAAKNNGGTEDISSPSSQSSAGGSSTGPVGLHSVGDADQGAWALIMRILVPRLVCATFLRFIELDFIS